MKLKPRQIIGLGAIVVFGGILVATLMRPKPDPYSLPNGIPFSSLPSPVTPEIEFPMPDLQYTTPLPPGGAPAPMLSAPAIDYTTLGSQSARDDLYCAGTLNAEFNVVFKTGTPDAAAAMLDDAQSLKGAGLAKLKTEGASTGDDWAFFTLAYDALAEADHAAGKLRISAADCAARAAALPADSPPPP